MRVYKFLDAKYGLKSLREKRLKQSCVRDLNDPFELMPFDLTHPAVREASRETKKDMDKEKGLLCFSKNWCDPVIWAHYSDKHSGLCLGFEIPEPDNDNILEVVYIDNPLPFPLKEYLERPEEEGEQITRNALFTKFKHWEYEQEIRIWDQLGKQKKGSTLCPLRATLSDWWKS